MSLVISALNEALGSPISVKRLLLLGPIPIPNVQNYSLIKDANIRAYKSDAGYSITQIGERNLDVIDMTFLLTDEASKLAHKLAIEAIYEASIPLPFISELAFITNAIIEHLSFNKTKERRGVITCTIRLKEVRSTILDMIIKGIDAGINLALAMIPDSGTFINSGGAKNAAAPTRPSGVFKPVA